MPQLNHLCYSDSIDRETLADWSELWLVEAADCTAVEVDLAQIDFQDSPGYTGKGSGIAAEILDRSNCKSWSDLKPEKCKF